MSWASAPWGASWDTGVGSTPSVTPWDMLQGRQQGRLVPTEVSVPDGSYSFVLGAEGAIAEHLTELEVGDYAEVSQTGDFDTETFIDVPVKVRGPETLASGTSGWKIVLLINAVERASRTFVAGEVVDTVLSANVSALAGANTVTLRLELV